MNSLKMGWLRQKKTEKDESILVPLDNEGMPVAVASEDRDYIGRFADSRLVSIREPHSIAAEQYRVLCTRVAQLVQNRASYTLAITSSAKAEGKSFTSMNLAISMARDFDEQVLLIEGDLKNPSLHEYLKRSPGFGLSDLLEGKIDFDTSAIQLFDGKLSVLLAGKTVGSPSRILSSPKMREILTYGKAHFKYIIIDTPPIIPLVDISIFSNLVDGILLVIKAGKTPRSLVKRALATLPPDKVIGSVLNQVEYNYNKYYYGTKYSY